MKLIKIMNKFIKYIYNNQRLILIIGLIKKRIY
jgi:hypothetical protein